MDQKKSDDSVQPSRRGFLAGAGGLLAAAGTAATAVSAKGADAVAAKGVSASVPFRGARQAGIETPQQAHTYFAALDLQTAKRDDVIAMLKTWTAAASHMTAGQFAAPLNQDLAAPGADSNEAAGLAPARLTLTFGFGSGLFAKDGKDRYGLAAHRPEALVDLPKFNGDQLIETKTGGDLSIQACAEDPQVAFHAVRQLVRVAYGAAEMRWSQSGFLSKPAAGGTPRNLMGFKDGTARPANLDEAVWVGDEGRWMKGGSYVVARRIRMALEHWDRTDVDFQEQVIGRHKYSGAPIGKKKEFDAADFDAADKDGNPVIADTAHLRLAHPSAHGGAQIFRRGYSYNDGVNFTAERWPPWRQGMEYDAGLFFVAYQRDPRTGFIKIFEKMAKLDMLNQFVTHTGGGLFACPRGVADGEYIGQHLFEI